MRRHAGLWLSCAALACAVFVGCSDETPASQPPAAGSAAGSPAGTGAGSGGMLAAGSGGTGPTAGSSGASAAGSGGGPAAGSLGAPAAGSGMPAAGTGMPAAGSGGTPTARSLTATIVAKGIPPEGQEHVCVVADLGNTQPVWVSRATAVLTGGSHHLIVDRRPASATINTTPTVCAPTMASDDSRLMIAQQAMTTLQLPPGVAFRLEARQRVFLQLHYFNVSGAARDISGTVELFLADPEAGTPMEAKTLFTGQTQIMLPARMEGEVKAFFMTSDPQRRFFALTSHTHRLGIRATIERVASINAAAVTPLHESTSWEEPPLTVLDPPLAFDGKDGLRLTCRYRNDTDQPVNFGVEAHDEMCFMWLYYFDQR